MGFRKPFVSEQIIADLRRAAGEVEDSRNDGWTAWACKQDLYRVKFALDELLRQCPTFADEQKWVEQQQIWKTLTKKVQNDTVQNL